MNYLSLFSGIGAFEKALDRLGIPYNLVNYCEIDKYASKSYSAIHGVPESLNLGDITKVDTSKLSHIDMISYGFPCQDISLAGKQKGLFNEDGTQTRSGLFFEALRIIEDTKPKVAIAENVKNLTSKKFKEQFEIVLNSLESAGYNNYWQVLNAKDYGVPQNRERVFIVSVRKDIDTGLFKFPEPFELKLRLKDLLEPVVDEKFYLSDKFMAYVTTNDAKQREKGNGFRFSPTDGDTIAKAIRTGPNNKMDDNFIYESECIEVANLNHYKNDQMNRVYSPDGIAPTQLVKSGGGRETKILEQGTVIDDTQGFDGTRYYDNVSPSLRASRSGLKVVTASQQGLSKERFFRQAQETLIENECNYGDTIDAFNKRVNKSELCPTLTTRPEGFKTAILPVTNDLRIRKLTPLECWRLMGFDDEDFYKAEKVCSNSQLYKQAGNSIVVDVLVSIFDELKKAIF